MEKNSSKKGFFFRFDAMFNKLHGKELSYNNLLDVDAAVTLISEFKTDDPTFAILKTTLVALLQENDK
jgi:phosphoribosylaminoimidazolecarboxamide formyltransferase/IMP cyclohydrolase